MWVAINGEIEDASLNLNLFYMVVFVHWALRS